MVALDNPSVRLCLAGLDHLTFVVWVVELKAVLVKHHMSEIRMCLRLLLNLCVAPYRLPGLIYLPDTEVL